MADSARRVLAIAVVSALPLWRIAAAAESNQALDQERVRALFVLNVSRFVEWPVDVIASGGDLRICTTGDIRFRGALESAVTTRRANGNSAGVSVSNSRGDWSGCHVLFISHWSSRDVPKILASVRDGAVLTISDTPGFVAKGGVVGFRVDGSTVKFRVNRDAARRAGLKFSSHVLRLADSKE